MFDTMTLTKVVGSLCGALLIFLLGGWAGELLFHVGGGHHGDQQAYLIDTGEEEAAEETAEEDQIDFLAMVAAADASKGERVFGKCAACHKLDGSDGTGPHLNGIVGKAKAASDGYAYSTALADMADDVWSEDNLNLFLENPRGYAPGTKMAFAGLKKASERADLVAYLQATN